MTDPRGIIILKAGKKSHKLELTINQICDMEADFSEQRGVDMDCIMIGHQLEGAKFRSIRKVMFHALVIHWTSSDGDLTEERTGEIMQEAGIKQSAVAIGELWRLTFPQPAPEVKGDAGDQDGEGEGEDEDGVPVNREQRRAAKSGNASKK